MRIANFQMPIERTFEFSKAFKSAIGNWKSKMYGWPTRPGSHKLGAKWVEVIGRRSSAGG